MLRPAPEDAVEPQNGVKLRMTLAATHPHRTLVRIKRIVGHYDGAHTGDLQHFPNMALKRLHGEESPRLL